MQQRPVCHFNLRPCRDNATRPLHSHALSHPYILVFDSTSLSAPESDPRSSLYRHPVLRPLCPEKKPSSLSIHISHPSQRIP